MFCVLLAILKTRRRVNIPGTNPRWLCSTELFGFHKFDFNLTRAVYKCKCILLLFILGFYVYVIVTALRGCFSRRPRIAVKIALLEALVLVIMRNSTKQQDAKRQLFVNIVFIGEECNVLELEVFLPVVSICDYPNMRPFDKLKVSSMGQVSWSECWSSQF